MAPPSEPSQHPSSSRSYTAKDPDDKAVPASEESSECDLDSNKSQSTILQDHRPPITTIPATAYNIPMIHVFPKETSRQSYAQPSVNLLSSSHYSRLAGETKKHILGPMPVQTFLEHFLKCNQIGKDDMSDPTDAFIGIPSAPSKEEDIYSPLVEAVNRTADRESRCPGFVFCITAKRPDTSEAGEHGQGAVKPDVSAYPEVHYHYLSSKYPHSAGVRTDMGFVALFIEIKKNKSEDCFVDPIVDNDFVPRPASFTNNNSDEHLGQIINYALEVVKRQHRQHVFSVSLCGTSARLIRWDRAGAVVSRAFDILTHPHLLCEFLWCYARISQHDRGFDCSVQLGTLADDELFQKEITKHIRTQVARLRIGTFKVRGSSEYYLMEHRDPGVISSIPLSLPPDPELMEPARQGRLLISRPIVVPHSLTGRGYWRFESRRPEGDILQELSSFEVPHIPTVLHHKDVSGPRCGPLNITDYPEDFGPNPKEHILLKYTDYVDAAWVYPEVRQNLETVRMVHYRLIMKEAGYFLTRLRGTQELLYAGRGVLRALTYAYFNLHPTEEFPNKTPRLHRNVSPNNIMLYRDVGSEKPRRYPRTGYLINWDVSHTAPTNPDEPETNDPMAPDEKKDVAASVDFPFTAYQPLYHLVERSIGFKLDSKGIPLYSTILHDIDSLLYSVLYCALFYTEDGLPPGIKGGVTLTLFPDVQKAALLQPGNLLAPLGKKEYGERIHQTIPLWKAPGMRSWADLVTRWADIRTRDLSTAVQPTEDLQEYIKSLRCSWTSILSDNALFAEHGRSDARDPRPKIRNHRATSTASSSTSVLSTIPEITGALEEDDSSVVLPGDAYDLMEADEDMILEDDGSDTVSAPPDTATVRTTRSRAATVYARSSRPDITPPSPGPSRPNVEHRKTRAGSRSKQPILS
ncbi:uncharacterized protein BXZ73DRAFT_77414 [Epithele typhae]|uniref:uncharacterized protein n=1 Tax=Epithele typhae TaxID=378194 RepID=UPI0020071FD2|nr:uncharacterized protein BXZ73DRAFT_77414 [Epithele typhae]KAH9932696.1 hypothetical protein BXZ73DRAFT_77414 [Epithele typhae]